MAKYNLNDIDVLTDFHRAIRKRAYMYSLKPHDPLQGIIQGITDFFQYLEVKDFRVTETVEFVSIAAKQDWLKLQEGLESVEMAFNNSMRPEVYLEAFYFDLYTSGLAGNYGDRDLMSQFSTEDTFEYIGTQGRVLIVSKTRNLPDNHEICYERPPLTKGELENEKARKALAEQTRPKNLKL